MARPMTQEHKAATEAAKAQAETRERKEHMAQADTNKDLTAAPIERPLTPPTE